MASTLELYLLAMRSARPPIAGWVDTTTMTNTTTSLAGLSKAWTIPAYDPQPGVAYRLTCGGFGSIGSTNENLDFQLTAFSINFGGSVVAGLGTSISFHWRYQGEIAIIAAGGAGTADYAGTFTWSAAVSATSEAQSIAAHASAVTINTTANASAQFEGNWAATTGGPSITCLYSVFERIGA